MTGNVRTLVRPATMSRKKITSSSQKQTNEAKEKKKRKVTQSGKPPGASWLGDVMLQATFEPPFETMGALGREKGGTREVLDTGWLIQLREH